MVLGVSFSASGDAVSERLVREGDAIPAGTDEAGGANSASPSASDAQRGGHLGGRCGGLQLHGETDHQIGVWISRAETLEIASHHQLGNLPEPEFTHRFR